MFLCTGRDAESKVEYAAATTLSLGSFFAKVESDFGAIFFDFTGRRVVELPDKFSTGRNFESNTWRQNLWLFAGGKPAHRRQALLSLAALFADENDDVVYGVPVARSSF